MPTQEERLETAEFNLRQFKTETVKVYQDMAFEMTIVKALTEDSIGRVAKLSETTQRNFERIDTRLDGMDAHLVHMDGRLTQVEARLTQMDARLTQVETRLTQMDARLTQVDTRFDRIENMLAQILARLPEKS